MATRSQTASGHDRPRSAATAASPCSPRLRAISDARPDGSGRRREDARVYEASERLERLLDANVVGLAVADADRIVEANDEFLRILGRSRAELEAGRLRWADLTPAEWADADAAAFESLLATGSAPPYEKEYLRPDGTRAAAVAAVALLSREPFAAVAFLLDRTAQREAEHARGRQLAEERRARDEVEDLSRTLQRGLLPDFSLPSSSFRVVSAYRPGEARLALGGDFRDAVELPSGDLGLLVGDVSGHGAAAAALGANLRAAWRALALAGATDLAAVAKVLDRVLAHERPHPEAFATVVLAMLDPSRTAATIVRAGHPEPLLVHEGGVDPVAAPAGPPLGVALDPRWTTYRQPLPAAGALVLYTDGLVEGRAAARSLDRFGRDRLAALLARLGPAGVLDGLAGVIDTVVAAHGEGLPDDVAVLATAWSPGDVAGG